MRARWQDLFYEVQILQLGLVGKFDIKLDVHVAEVVVPERRHALTLNALDGTRRDRVARENIDSQPPFVEMLNVDLPASNCCEQIYLSMVDQVVFFSLES